MVVLRVAQAWWRWLVLGVAVLLIVAVAVARLYRGAHYLTDVLASVLFTVPWLLATTKACAPSHNRWVHPEQPAEVSIPA
jgi:membrane-associated phospholipid phosphatase